ncbi:hypothetical protein CEXT_706741 [Caerostris extrusa]|uniref:Uncharacterized protein n=1 Tax=Caerostris extrusa TaxID=172846 RepID=A0AAV4PVW4_CAEEX|nr:hypothetical protein CEXT_706741 [Caerostris extrusa]
MWFILPDLPLLFHPLHSIIPMQSTTPSLQISHFHPSECIQSSCHSIGVQSLACKGVGAVRTAAHALHPLRSTPPPIRRWGVTTTPRGRNCASAR